MTTIELPKCEWCKELWKDAYKCRSCGKYCCNDCHLGYDNSDRCSHLKYEPFSSDNWKLK